MALFLVGLLSGAALAGAASSEPLAPVPRLTSEEAVVRALNSLRPVEGGLRLEHPRHRVGFTREGVRFEPRRGPVWRWRLEGVRAGERPLAGIMSGVSPQLRGATVVAYDRAGVVEEYVVGKESVEQRFVVPEPLPLAGEDLVVRGRIDCSGSFDPAAGGWRWRDERGEVWLGVLRVFDARGRELPSRMEVTAAATRMVVDGGALAGAAYPVVLDPEIGANDFRISDMGGVGNSDYGAFDPAVAYNSTDNEYLVVWHGEDNVGGLVEGELEIFGQRLDAVTGGEVGANDFRISDMGGTGSPDYLAANPAVAYNATNNEYLVVWWGDDNVGGLVDGEYEIFGQRLTASGAEILPNDFRISDMGGTGDPAYDAFGPVVAYNATANEYLVVWRGEDNVGGLVAGEREIFGQRLTASGVEILPNDFRISDLGGTGDPAYDAFGPAVAANATDNQYLVVWQGDDNVGGLVDEEFEIFGQRLTATGAETGANDFRISDMGGTGNPDYDAAGAAVAYNATANEYLVVWSGDDTVGGLANDELEIFAQRLTADGSETGANDFRISDVGSSENPAYSAGRPAVAYNATDNEYLVVWQGDDNVGGLVAGEREIFGQRLTAGGAEIGANDFRLSDSGGSGETVHPALQAAMAYNATGNQYLVVWRALDNVGGLVDGELEIFGQRFSSAPILRPAWVHVTAAENIENNWTWLSHPLLDGRPGARIIVTQALTEAGPAANPREIGVWYSNTADRWAIFNQDRVAMPAGTSFHVEVVTDDAKAFVHTATLGNITDEWTYLEEPQEGDEQAIILVTPNWNPNGVGGVYNDHAIGLYFDAFQQTWAIYNQDLVLMPLGASFNVQTVTGDENAFVHTATVDNSAGHLTVLQHPLVTRNPAAIVLVTLNSNPGGGILGIDNDHPIAVSYSELYQSWLILNQDVAPMPMGASFNVLVLTEIFADGFESGNTAAWSARVP